ncbi:hypothetical protein EVA_13182 [gut metagenome]|uniref:Uncharacterized protein n=1 Tax=gut metagenome TaxID=749906 RepID=J9GAD0_9ZZZZ
MVALPVPTTDCLICIGVNSSTGIPLLAAPTAPRL